MCETDNILENVGERDAIFSKVYAISKELNYRSLSIVFQNLKYKYETSHVHHRIREDRNNEQLRVSYPRHVREYDDFIEYLRSIVIVDRLDKWDLIRMFVKIRGIIKYWKKMTYRKADYIAIMTIFRNIDYRTV